jgi:hypothetical protein
MGGAYLTLLNTIANMGIVLLYHLAPLAHPTHARLAVMQ